MGKTKQKPRVLLPSLHEQQKMVKESEATFKVLACGRRWGKSVLARIMALDCAINDGGQVWWVAPAYSTAADHWRATKLMVENAPFLHYKNEQQKYLEFRYNNKVGSLTFKSADKPDNLRGAGLDLVILDEAAFMGRDVWFEILMPTLMDKAGKALIISTPKGKANWFYTVYSFGSEDSHKKLDKWESWSFSSAESPYVDKDYVAMSKKTMPKHKFEQEILAKFQDNHGGAFTNLENAFVAVRAEPVSQLEDQLQEDVYYVMGIDWGRKNDFTVVSVFEANSGAQVDLMRFSDVGFETQSSKVMAMIEKWNPSRVYVETNSMGMVMFERLKSIIGSIAKPVYMTNKTKRNIIERLASGIEIGRITLLEVVDEDTSEQSNEFSSFEMKYTQQGLNVTYGAGRNQHDDTVIAAALAAIGISREGRAKAFEAVENVFY